MILNYNNLIDIDAGKVDKPDKRTLHLPEKVLQFGTGVLLRGLPDYFIHKANQAGIFNGRIVVVKSTSKGEISEFDQQNGLYTICVRGIENGRKIEENIICSSISRVLSAAVNWNEILTIAESADLELIISNTTEVGIQLVNESILLEPPVSFPAKLAAVLYRRFKAFNGDIEKGLIITPTELITNNGDKLKEIVIELAKYDQLEPEFIDWINAANQFCNTLVDRIVPGKPDADKLVLTERELNYSDELLFMAEVYKFWAIEGNEKTKSALSFIQADPGVIVTDDINIHRELKLRLLNGTHSLSCALAFLSGFETVKEAMDNEDMQGFIEQLMKGEIAKAIPYPINETDAGQFADKILDRFRNPYIKHQWISISLNYSSKIAMRIIPVLQQYYKLYHQAPEHIALGFAAYILFMKSQFLDGKYNGTLNGTPYLINDEKAQVFAEAWRTGEINAIVQQILSNETLWSYDLTSLPGFEKTVSGYLDSILKNGVLETIKGLQKNNVSA